MDEDVRVYAKSADALRSLIERVVNTSFLMMTSDITNEK